MQSTLLGISHGLADSRLRLCALTVLVAIAAIALVVGSVPGNLSLQPEPARYQAHIFKEPFLSFVALTIAWLVSMLRRSPVRAQECRLLLSLPLSSAAVANRLVWGDVSRSGWVLAMIPLTYLALWGIAPIPYLCRLFVLTASLWLVAIILNVGVQLFASLVSRGQAGFPTRYVSLWLALSLLGYVVCQVVMLASPSLISGASFWILLLSCLAAIPPLVLCTHVLFGKWLRAGRHVAGEEHRRESHHLRPGRRAPAQALGLCFGRLQVCPLVMKGSLCAWRRLSLASLFSMTALLWLGYLMASNNLDAQSRAWVLLGVFVLYCLLHAHQTMGLFSPEDESPQLVYSLPVTKLDLYLSMLIPGATGPLLWATGYAVLLWVSGCGAEVAIRFRLIASLSAISLVAVATNFAVGLYPNHKVGQRRFLVWTSCLVLGAAVAGRHIPLVIVPWIAVSFLSLVDTRLHRRQGSSLST